MRRLSESTWGEMRHRSSGKVIRKEDDVNHMDFDAFADYIKDNYSERGNWFAVRESEDGKSRSIEIDIIYGKEIDLSFNVVEGEIYNILVNGNKNYVDIPGLKEIFNVNIIGSSSFSVYEKNWTISNNTFVKLIEFFLDKKTNESVWGDMRKKSSGETIRKEDDINNLDFEEFFEYLQNTYTVNDPRGFFEIGNYRTPGTDIENISIPMEINDCNVTPNLSNRMFLIRYDLEKGEYLSLNPNKYFFRLYPKEMKKVLGDKYFLESISYSIIPKNNEKITNQTCIDVIDKLISIVEEPLTYRRKVNESAWGEMRKRSAGEQERKEDNVNLLDIDGLYEYIKSKYEKRLFYLDKDVYGPLNKKNIVADVLSNVSLFTIYDKKGNLEYILLSWSKVKIRMPFFDKLSERFNVQSPNVCRRRITEKDGTCTNQTYIDVIDFFLENIDNMLVNESAWGEMRRRSSGETIRKEDDVNILDRQGLVYYLKEHYKCENPTTIIQTVADGGTIYVCLYVDTDGYDNILMYDNIDGDRHMYLSGNFKDNAESIYNEMCSEYTLTEMNDYDPDGHPLGNIKVEPKGCRYENLTNGFFLEVLDFIIERIQEPLKKQISKKTINESAWGDMRKKSSGEDVRKEDVDLETEERIKTTDFDLFTNDIVFRENTDNSIEGFKTFVENNRFLGYYCAIDWNTRKTWKDNVIPFIEKYWDKRHYKEYVDELISKKENEVSKLGFKKEPGKSIYDTVNDWWNTLDYDDKYDVLLGCGIEDDSKYEKYSNDELWDDMDYIEQVNAYMNYMKTNESVWGDMRKKSAGETIRKEDEIPQDLQAPLAVYIDMFASNAFSGDYTVGSYPDFRAFVKDFMNSPRIKSLDFDMGDLLDYITQDHYYDVIHPVIMDTIQKINNEIDVAVDNIIDSLKDPNMNESAWGDMRKRSSGEETRKEDILTNMDVEHLSKYISNYANEVVYGRGMGEEACNLDSFCDYIENDNEIKDVNVAKILQYVKDNWADEICDDVAGSIEQAQLEYNQDMYESIWGDMRKRSSGEEIRKEDEMTSDDFLILRETAKMFRNVINSDVGKRNVMRVNGGKLFYIDDCDSFIKYILARKKGHFWNNVPDETYDKAIKFVEKNWEEGKGIQEFIDTYLSNLNECDGVPGGLTPANVGGMGAAYFPGPNGEPGSGDLPSPTGIVYHQVAPYTTFLKQIKKKKKKAKKFRKEDEPCVHSENPPIYSHVDDFRDYVDRVYNQIDRKK